MQMKAGNDLLKRLIQLLSELFKMMPGRVSAQFTKLEKTDLKTWNCPSIKICFLEQLPKQIGEAEDTEFYTVS